MRILFFLTALMSFGFAAISVSSVSVESVELKANEKIFKAGFEAGIKALEFQRKNDGYKPKKVTINKAYYLTYNISKLPYEEALFLQNIAAREGFDTHITKNLLFFGEFEREADALKTQADLKTKFRIDAQVKQNYGSDSIETYPKLWGQFYTFFQNEVKKQGYIDVDEACGICQKYQNEQALQAAERAREIEAQKEADRLRAELDKIRAAAEKEKARLEAERKRIDAERTQLAAQAFTGDGVNSPKTKQTKQTAKTQITSPKTTTKTAYFTLKHSKAMAYTNTEINENSRTDSLQYKELGLQDSQKFLIGNFKKPYITKQGEVFYKVLNKNIYFSDKDVIIEK